MKPKRITYYLLSVFGLLLLTQYSPAYNPSLDNLQANKISGPSSDYLLPDMGCSVIYASDGEVAFGGNNEDYINPSTMAWFLPPEDGKFGRVYFGYEGFIWGGGMNDQGLFFDALAVDQPMAVLRSGKPSYDGSIEDKAMAECRTVDCVVDLYSQYHSYDTWYHQFLFGDAEGNSVIIEPNQFLRSEENYQVATNFYQSVTYIPTCNTCNRYLTADAMFEAADEFSVDFIRDILDAVHIEKGSPTLYSTVYDLKAGIIYLYFFHDFENVKVFNLDEELEKGYHAYVLADLFPENREFADWAKPELEQISAKKAAYQPVQVDMEIYDPYVGEYAIPAELGLPYPFYAISMENDTLVLKIKTDKAWLDLTPLSDTSFYHVSSFSQFEITFLEDEGGQFNQFLYEEDGNQYIFTRITEETTDLATLTPVTPTPTPELPTPSPSATSTEVPTSTDEPTGTPETPIVNTQIPSEVQPPQTPSSENSTNPRYPLALPILGFVILVGWLFVRSRKK